MQWIVSYPLRGEKRNNGSLLLGQDAAKISNGTHEVGIEMMTARQEDTAPRLQKT